MSDEHLSDHEWKQKMADEGRAFYLPGRASSRPREKSETSDQDTITVNLNIGQAEALETAIADLPELAYQVAHTLDTFAAAISMGSLASNDLQPILALIARAVKSAETKEIAALEGFDTVLRKSLSSYRETKAQVQKRKKA